MYARAVQPQGCYKASDTGLLPGFGGEKVFTAPMIPEDCINYCDQASYAYAAVTVRNM